MASLASRVSLSLSLSSVAPPVPAGVSFAATVRLFVLNNLGYVGNIRHGFVGAFVKWFPNWGSDLVGCLLRSADVCGDVAHKLPRHVPSAHEVSPRVLLWLGHTGQQMASVVSYDLCEAFASVRELLVAQRHLPVAQSLRPKWLLILVGRKVFGHVVAAAAEVVDVSARDTDQSFKVWLNAAITWSW